MIGGQAVKNVVIVGGGTAGWMAAASFAKLLGKSISVTLIESDEISTVGVGEATVPPLILLNRYLEINEQEFLAFVKGSIKLGISFENWKNVNENYFHMFGTPGKDTWAASFQHFWLRGKELGVNHPLGDYSLEHKAAEHNKFAHMPNASLNYAYHLDAGFYAKFLRNIAEQAGATRIEGKVTNVSLDKDDYIKSIELASGHIVEGDLFIDCSGFRGLLIEQALHTGYEDWSHWLPCDSAVAVQTESVRDPVPYTRSIAHASGWQWQIPLQHRVGNGLVYCSRYISDDDAKKLLLDNIQGRLISEPKIIKYRTGQRLKHWNKNCVALGLASGFIEPLESTSIHLIQRGITRLIQMFPFAGIRACDVDEYNEQMKVEILNVRDFIILHYHLTDRNDSPFWQYCRNMDIPESLEHRMRMFRETGKVFVKSYELFSEASWLQVMVGQGLIPENYHPVANEIPADDLVKFLAEIRTQVNQNLPKMPTHKDYLDFYCKASDWN
ncbi:tryptophan halogenase family protein [Cellvibrio fibrivorans]|uniref:Tryptophan halogenase n=1 Tax=Cellvibrio fibrivorans TaxID=126350 RepID=A0ABU1UXY4_9GAMM|nr:tryptophan 7-halogenase [Cellvibrio fibrivorans]MDR7090021.1 tryptophan halogenase [Cellvibrio fibrivorans]